MEVISRKYAKALGLKHYFTGKPCKRGHVDKRQVSSFGCMTCQRENVLSIYRSLSVDDRRAQRHRRRESAQKWRAENRDQLLAYLAEYNKLRKQGQPNYFKSHYAANRERRKIEAREWYHENAEYALERTKAYAAKRLEEMPEHVRAIGRKNSQKRRALKRDVFVEDVDPRVVFKRDKGICGICAKPVEPASAWEVDHIHPLSKGGEHSYRNTQLAHRVCNRAKGARVDGQVTDDLDARDPEPHVSESASG